MDHRHHREPPHPVPAVDDAHQQERRREGDAEGDQRDGGGHPDRRAGDLRVHEGGELTAGVRPDVDQGVEQGHGDSRREEGALEQLLERSEIHALAHCRRLGLGGAQRLPPAGFRHPGTQDHRDDRQDHQVQEHDAPAGLTPFADDDAERLGRDDAEQPQDVGERDELAALPGRGLLRDHRQGDRQVRTDGESEKDHADVQRHRTGCGRHDDRTHGVDGHRRQEDAAPPVEVAQAAADQSADRDHEGEQRGVLPELRIRDAERLDVQRQSGARRDDGGGIQVGRHTRDRGAEPHPAGDLRARRGLHRTQVFLAAAPPRRWGCTAAVRASTPVFEALQY